VLFLRGLARATSSTVSPSERRAARTDSAVPAWAGTRYGQHCQSFRASRGQDWQCWSYGGWLTWRAALSVLQSVARPGL